MVTVIKKGQVTESVKAALGKAFDQNGVDTRNFCGIIKLEEDPLKIQKKMRNEWK